MKINFVSVVAFVLSAAHAAEQIAFPTAEGYGRFAKGGRGGRVIHVTNLNDSGPGSLRDAVEASGPRTVVFDVSGLITLESKLVVRKTNSNLTIAGQTAPGKGICIRKFNFGMMGAHDVIIRYLRVRPGNISGTTLDGMGMASSGECIIDHCSISWTLDEAFSSRGATNITLQRTLISEALNEAGHKKYPPGTQHGYAASIGGDIGSFHHNLLAHCAGRNWSLAGGLDKKGFYVGRLDIRNNVVYNWKNRATDGGAHEVNFVNNYYQPGPATKTFYALNAQYGGFAGTQQYFFEGNVMSGQFGLTNQPAGRTATTERGGSLPTNYSSWVNAPFFEPRIKTHSAHESYSNVLANVGCNFPVLDEHDQRVVAEVRDSRFKFKGSKTGLPGLPDSQDDVGGWEDYPEVHRPVDWDTDRDGMPNDWEKRVGLNPNDPEDGNKDLNGDGYTNLEKYLNSLVGEYKSGPKKVRPTMPSHISPISPIGLIGLGLMGHAISERLRGGRLDVLGFDIAKAQQTALSRLGGAIATDASSVFAQCDHVILSLPDDKIASTVLRQAARTLHAGHVIIDTSTGSPKTAVTLGRRLARRGVTYLDATISGNSEQMRKGEVVLMVGGKKRAFDKCADLFRLFSKQAIHTGPCGSGAKMKLVTNLVLGLNRAALAEALVFTRALGLDGEQTLAVLRATMAYSRIMDTKGEKMLRGDFRPQARLSQHLKDVRLMLAAAASAGTELPLSKTHRKILERAEAAGLGDLDNSALIRVIGTADVAPVRKAKAESRRTR